ncbi:hypothetical protein [uncultured Paracoccus sp.]|uniref:phage adaptor protein n=1 Tax=uncultured Paracoccus sp. TaxID=189685 RepID=UPI0026386CAF|nr:hypothetical protein [uncultured Paracoccus sp.]
MATSGAITSTMTAGQVVTRALRICAVLGRGETAEAEDMQDGVVSLNLMLKSWQATGPNLWRETDGSVTLTNATATYTLSPRPIEVLSCRYRNASGTDMPMEQLTDDEYQEIPLKTSAGIPTTFYVNKQRDATTITVWPVLATVTTETLRYSYQRVIEDVTAQSQHIDVPQEALDLVIYGLASRFLDEFGITGERARRIVDRYMALKQQFDGFDREPFVQFVPSWS